jgi:zinc transport system substrate-binding protein
MAQVARALAAVFVWTAAFGVLHAAASEIKVFVSIAPQQYFVQKIGGELVEVSVLVPPAADPHTYEPKPRQMAEISKAAVYFAVGVDFEKAWLPRIAAANPKMRIVRTDEGLEKIAMAAHHHGDTSGLAKTKKHAHGAEQAVHASGGEPDPHVWLSPPLVKIQAQRIAAALGEADPGNRERYAANLERFRGEIEALDSELKALFAGCRGARFLVFHPSWGYFAAAYGLEQVPIEIEGKEPKPAQLRQIILRAREQGIRAVFVQPQLSTKSAEMVAREIGGRVVSADPLAVDWAENLRDVGRKFKEALP